MNTLRERWMSYWFQPESPYNLAICRILFYGAFFLYYAPVDFSEWGAVSEAFYTPSFLFAVLNIPVLPPAVIAAMQIVWKLSLLLCCVGLFGPISKFSVLVLGYYLLGLPQNMGKIHHFDGLLILIFGILLFARTNDVLSADAKLLRRGGSSEPHGEYRWPIRMIWLSFAIIFLSSGLSKLMTSGLEWIGSENMSIILLKQQYPTSDPGPIVDWGIWVAGSPWLYMPLAAITLFLELGYPLALFNKYFRWIFVPGMFMAQVGIRILMGPAFYPFLIANLFWIPWHRLLPQLQKRASRGNRYAFD